MKNHQLHGPMKNFSMSRLLKTLGCIAATLIGWQSAQAFSLLGPYEPYQVPEIGYNLPGDIGGPHNLGEFFRWNTPVTYYAADESFLDYFRSNGLHAIESAFEVFNALTNTPFSTINPNDFPTDTRRVNHKAQQLQLVDLKSDAMALIIEELGLTESERYVWTIRNRRTQPGLSCPFMIYDVIMRSFDPITFEPSPYVNGNLFSYLIIEICSGPNPLAVTFNFPVDPTVTDLTPVTEDGAAQFGTFFTGLTRDDVGGLRYLYRSQNVTWENPSDDSLEFVTNLNRHVLIYTSNLLSLAQIAITNDTAGLNAIFPNLQVLSSSNTFAAVTVTNFTAYTTNFPWDPITAPPHVVIVPVPTVIFTNFFTHTFGNLFSLSNTPTGPVIVPLLSLPAPTNRVIVTMVTNVTVTNSFTGLPVTITTAKSFVTNTISGDFVILPPNACDLKILNLLGTVTNASTNVVLSSTNLNFTLPNGVTNLVPFDIDLVTYSTQRVFDAFVVECNGTNGGTLRRGIDRIQFIRTSYDSLIGRFYQPITNIYYLLEITNSVQRTNWFERIVTRPDWLFRAYDAPGIPEEFGFRTDTASNFQTNDNTLFDLQGPGHINPHMNIDYNKVGPNLVNVYSPFAPFSDLHQAGAFTNFIWGSFDSTTNAPIVYPEDIRIDDIERLLVFQITSADLPNAVSGQDYSTQLTLSGGEEPVTWSLAANSAPLPDALVLESNGLLHGTVTAPPGTYVFTVMASDVSGRSTTRTITLNVVSGP
jgi:Putative Ig domain